MHSCSSPCWPCQPPPFWQCKDNFAALLKAGITLCSSSGTKFSCARIARKPCPRASHCVTVHPDIFASHPSLFEPNTKPNSKSKIFRSVMFPFLSLLTNRLPFQLWEWNDSTNTSGDIWSTQPLSSNCCGLGCYSVSISFASKLHEELNFNFNLFKVWTNNNDIFFKLTIGMLSVPHL